MRQRVAIPASQQGLRVGEGGVVRVSHDVWREEAQRGNGVLESSESDADARPPSLLRPFKDGNANTLRFA